MDVLDNLEELQGEEHGNGNEGRVKHQVGGRPVVVPANAQQENPGREEQLREAVPEVLCEKSAVNGRLRADCHAQHHHEHHGPITAILGLHSRTLTTSSS